MKIGLIAMSGIRACDTELLELGLTLPGFVERSKQIASLPSLGLLTLAGMTPRHHDVHYIEIPDLHAEEGELEEFDLVAISSYSAQIDEGYELAQRYRAQGTPVVMGGPHVTALPHEAQKYCTSVVAGEGEPVWLDVLEDALPRFVSRSVLLLVDQLLLQCRKETLHRRVVPTVPSPAHAAGDPVRPQQTLVVSTGVLAAPIRVSQQALLRDLTP